MKVSSGHTSGSKNVAAINMSAFRELKNDGMALLLDNGGRGAALDQLRHQIQNGGDPHQYEKGSDWMRSSTMQQQ